MERSASQIAQRASAILLFLAIALPLPAIDTTAGRGNRICVLQVPASDFDDRVAHDIRGQLERTLRDRGFQMITADATFEDVRRTPAIDADYFVEIAGANAEVYPTGTLGAAAHNVGIDMSLVVSRVGAELRIYDGRTLELIDRRVMTRQSTTVAPSGIGFGGFHGALRLALPITDWGKTRAAVRSVVDEAAQTVAGVSGTPR